MHRSYRPASAGFSPQGAGMRIGSLICLLLVVGMLYSRARRPETWAWLVNEGTDAAPTEKGPAPPTRVAAAPAKADKSAAPRTPDAAPKNDPGKQAAENGGGFPEKAAPPAQGGDKSAVAVGSTVPPTDTIIPGPTDKDPEEQADVRAQFELLTDREALEAIEMPAYWRLFRWAWAQSFSEMERRAGISFDHLATLDRLRHSNESTPTMLTILSQMRFV